MYRGHYRITLGKEEISKIEKMLIEKWQTKDIVIINLLTHWKISFLTDDNKKVYRLLEIVEKYGGKVLRHWIDKVDDYNDV